MFSNRNLETIVIWTVPYQCTEPLILTIRFFSILPRTVPHQNGNRYPLIIEDREPYRTNMGMVNRLVLRTANRTARNGGP